MNRQQVETERARLNSLASQEVRAADALASKPGLTKADKAKIDTHLAKAAQYRHEASQVFGVDEAIERVNAVRAEMGLLPIEAPTVPTPSEQRASVEHTEFRQFLRTGLYEKRTGPTDPMSVAVDSEGGFLVPQDFYAKLTIALKQMDALWDDSVITLVESNHGNAQTFPLVDDTAAAAVQVTENSTSSQDQIAVIDRLLLGKVPTWRSGKIFATLEIIQDSAFPLENLIANAFAIRFQRGVSAANVSTLISSTTSGATSATGAAVVLDDCLNLMASVDPAYLASSKCFWGMPFATLIGLLKQKDSQGRYQWHPRTDANGRLLLYEKPVVLMPSLPAPAVNAQGTVVLGDFSRCVRRTVKNSLRLQAYTQTIGLVEQGVYAYESFLRTSFGVLASASSNSPIKYLTQAAS